MAARRTSAFGTSIVDLAGKKHDAALVSTSGDEHGALDAAVMRLDEDARRIQQQQSALQRRRICLSDYSP